MGGGIEVSAATNLALFQIQLIGTQQQLPERTLPPVCSGKSILRGSSFGEEKDNNKEYNYGNTQLSIYQS